MMKKLLLLGLVLIVIASSALVISETGVVNPEGSFSKQARVSLIVDFGFGLRPIKYLWRFAVDKLGIKNPFEKNKWIQRYNEKKESEKENHQMILAKPE